MVTATINYNYVRKLCCYWFFFFFSFLSGKHDGTRIPESPLEKTIFRSASNIVYQFVVHKKCCRIDTLLVRFQFSGVSFLLNAFFAYRLGGDALDYIYIFFLWRTNFDIPLNPFRMFCLSRGEKWRVRFVFRVYA